MLHINEETALALQMRANYIETGDVNLSRHDVADQLKAIKSKGREFECDIKRLTDQLIRSATLSGDQVKLVEALREHAARIVLD